MIHFGYLIKGDFEDNTITLQIEGKMELKSGEYVVVPKKLYDSMLRGVAVKIEKIN